MLHVLLLTQFRTTIKANQVFEEITPVAADAKGTIEVVLEVLLSLAIILPANCVTVMVTQYWNASIDLIRLSCLHQNVSQTTVPSNESTSQATQSADADTPTVNLAEALSLDNT